MSRVGRVPFSTGSLDPLKQTGMFFSMVKREWYRVVKKGSSVRDDVMSDLLHDVNTERISCGHRSHLDLWGETNSKIYPCCTYQEQKYLTQHAV